MKSKLKKIINAQILKKKTNRNNRVKAGILIFLLFFLGTSVISSANLEDKEQINIQQITEEIVTTGKTISDKPKINSRIALVYDRTSDKILYQKNGERKTPMASTTKIMTAIVIVENCNMKDVVTIESKAAGTGGSRLGLKKNDKITVNDLLYGLMLRSGNDSAVALAIHAGGSIEGFAEMMNQKADELGLRNSHFVVPHGLDMQEHFTTAYELAKMADYALNIPKIKEIVGSKTYTVTINGQPKAISNTNELLGNLDGVYGVKTGFTNGAGRCLVTACKKGKLDMITVVLGADTKKIRTADSIKLIEYTHQNYQMIEIKNKIEIEFQKWKEQNLKHIEINKGTEECIELDLEELEYETMAVKNTQIDNIKTEINVLHYLEAPTEKNRIIGNLKVMIGDETIEVLNIHTKKEIKKKGIKDYMKEFLELVP